MALKQLRIGSLPNIGQYDDGDYDKSISVDDPIECTAAPVAGSDVLRLDDVGVSVGDVYGPAASVDSNLAEFDGVTGKVLKDGSLSHADTLDAINKKHSQNTDTNLGVLGTKNPPIDDDLVVQRDSAAAFALVTSTWTQIKAFLKTYFDTLYGTLATSHARLHAISSTSDHSDVNLVGISNNDLMQWDDPFSKWEPKSIAEIVLGQSIDLGNIGVASTELTISGGGVTVSGSHFLRRHTIDTESDAASDDLTTINGGNVGEILIISAANDARTVVCKQGAGLLIQADFDLDSINDTIMLECKSANVWREISRASNG